MLFQFEPLSIDTFISLLVSAKIFVLLPGAKDISLMYSFSFRLKVNPVGFQDSPASIDLNTPIDEICSPSSSPVAI